MSKLPSNRIVSRCLISLCLFLMIAAPAAAQGDAGSSSADAGPADRLFLGFAEDPALAEDQWWEGQAEVIDYNSLDSIAVRLIFALQPYDRFEFGGRIGFGSTDTPAFIPDGSGSTDLDLWGKYHLGSKGDDTQFAVGALATVPTGDDTAGLGYDSFSAALFGSMRHRLPEAIVTGHVGARYNQDGRFLGVDLEAKNSFLAGVGVIFPLTDEISGIAEGKYESRRFTGGDPDFRILGGINWHLDRRGVVRAAVALGLTDGAPDTQILAGYALQF